MSREDRRPEPVPAATARPEAKGPGEICPNCGGPLDSRQCKVFCTRCGLLVYNCSEF